MTFQNFSVQLHIFHKIKQNFQRSLTSSKLLYRIKRKEIYGPLEPGNTEQFSLRAWEETCFLFILNNLPSGNIFLFYF